MVFGFCARSGSTSAKSNIRNVEMALTISANFEQLTHHVSFLINNNNCPACAWDPSEPGIVSN
jgi:hypothetical protein